MSDFHKLVQDTLLYCTEIFGEQKKSAVSQEIKVAPVKEKSVKAPEEKPKIADKKPQKNPVTSAKENALLEMRSSISSLTPSYPLLEKPCAVLIVYFQQNAEHRKFLEALSAAINEQLTTSKVLLAAEKEFATLLSTPFVKLILAPVKEGSPHQKEGKVLRLAPLDEYQNDPNLKRTLWNTLKSHFSPPSSSILRSIKL